MSIWGEGSEGLVRFDVEEGGGLTTLSMLLRISCGLALGGRT